MTSVGRSGQHAPTAAASWPIDEVHEPGHLAVPVQPGHPLLEAPDEQHPAVQLAPVHEFDTVLIGTRCRSLEGKRVVITGASRGLGAWLAAAFADAGASVALVARTEADLKAVADDLARPDPRAAPPTSPTRTPTRPSPTPWCAEWGGLDVWIGNAGISPMVAGPLGHQAGDVPPHRRRQPHRRRSSAPGPRPGSRPPAAGSSSPARSWASDPGPGLAAYSATKAALVGLAKGLALDLAPQGVTVNVVAPGWFDSPLTEAVAGTTRRWPPRSSATPPRAGGATPTTWSAPTCSWRSDASAFVTGTVLTVDGGTCSHDQCRRRSPGRAGRSAPPSPGSWRASPTPSSSPATVADADVTDEAAVRRVVDEAVAEHGQVDVVIGNAGVLSPNGRIHNLSTEDWDRCYRVNVLGAVNGIKAAVGVMRPQGHGSIILTASVSGLTAWSHAAPYCATKAAVIQLAKVAAVEYARDGIRVNCVCPGTFRSAIHDDLPRRGPRRHRRQAPPRAGLRPTTWSAPTRTWPATRPDGRRAAPWSSTAATRRRDAGQEDVGERRGHLPGATAGRRA